MVVSAEINKRFAGVPYASPSRHQHLHELLCSPASLSKLKVKYVTVQGLFLWPRLSVIQILFPPPPHPPLCLIKTLNSQLQFTLCWRSAHPACTQPGPPLYRVPPWEGQNKGAAWAQERVLGNLVATQAEIHRLTGGPPVRQVPGCRVRFSHRSRPAPCAAAPALLLGCSRPPGLLPAPACALFPPTPSGLRGRVPHGGCFLVSVSNSASRALSAPWTGAISSSEFKPEALILSASPNSLS